MLILDHSGLHGCMVLSVGADLSAIGIGHSILHIMLTASLLSAHDWNTAQLLLMRLVQ